MLHKDRSDIEPTSGLAANNLNGTRWFLPLPPLYLPSSTMSNMRLAANKNVHVRTENSPRHRRSNAGDLLNFLQPAARSTNAHPLFPKCTITSGPCLRLSTLQPASRTTGLLSCIYYPGRLLGALLRTSGPACTRVKRRCSTTGQIHQRRHKLLSCKSTLGLPHTHVEALGSCRSVREPSLPRHQVLTSLRVRHAQWKTGQRDTPTLALSSNLDFWSSGSAAQSCCASVDELFPVTTHQSHDRVSRCPISRPLQNMHNRQHRVTRCSAVL